MELADEERGRLARRAFRAYAEAVLLDGAIDQDEDIVWSELWQALGLERSTELTDLARRLLIVRAANGCPEILSDHKLFTRAAESVFLEIDSGLLGRQQVEFQGHVIGSEVVVSVAGTLSVTSQRVVFIGDARSIEFEYGDIVAAEYYSNGIRFQVANAETFVFKLPDGWGEVVAAITDHARANEAAA